MTMKVVIVEETRKDPEFAKVQHHHAVGDIGAYGTDSSVVRFIAKNWLP